MATKKTTDAETATETTVTETKAPVFTRKQLRNSKKFAKYKDIVAVVVNEGESCTIDECEKRINKFLNKKCERSVK